MCVCVHVACTHRQESGSGLRPIPGVFAHALCALSDAAWDALSSGDMNTRKELSVRVAEVCTLLQVRTHTDIHVYGKYADTHIHVHANTCGNSRAWAS